MNAKYHTDPEEADADFPFSSGHDNSANCSTDPVHLSCLLPVGDRDTKDAVILEFEFTPSTDSVVQFDFIFASEEYPEFLTTENLKNDAFAVFVDYDSTNENKAWLPGTAVPITVDTINDENFNGTNMQIDYYEDNPAMPSSVFLLPYDGFVPTLSGGWLTTEGVCVDAEDTVTIRIVIADEEDESFDSVVFIRPVISFDDCE